MTDQTKAQLLDDLIKLISHNDYGEETMRRANIFCAYHGLFESYYSSIDSDALHKLALQVFEEIGEKSETVEKING